MSGYFSTTIIIGFLQIIMPYYQRNSINVMIIKCMDEKSILLWSRKASRKRLPVMPVIVLTVSRIFLTLPAQCPNSLDKGCQIPLFWHGACLFGLPTEGEEHGRSL
jgi:hypothetical protein